MNRGRIAFGDRAGGLRPEPPSASQPKALIPLRGRTCSDCGKRLNPRNTSGLCQKHFNERKTASKRHCSECGNELNRATKGEKCQKCYYPPRADKFCVTCGTQVCSRQNESGYCRDCLLDKSRHDPEIQAKRIAAVKVALGREDVREKLRANQRRLAADPKARERWSIAGRRNYHLTLGSAAGRARANAPDTIARRARTHSDRDLAWCPREYRDEYRALYQNRRYIDAAKAKEMILAKVEADRLNALATYDNLSSATDHLRRYAPVFKREDFYLYGTATLTPQQLIKRALDKGWQPPFAVAA